ncbi:tRNA pseudouridine(38-40) synthase TruA [Metabacillus arenae]|uniref:tRNA pseudouridine(38-40) synthase TruA n=1 Tax=Metabacillus arenae TaxID=2771434 RepID=UPI0029643D59|nr:tRNA pseudouridine(38-40) synthase TruA [Metabacillus arenae]
MRLKCTVAYDGTNFHGYQIQLQKRTVQLELEKALQKLHKGEKVKAFASGRTDSGVHAHGQVIHFDTLLHIPLERWPYALNSLLPDDVACLNAEKTDAHFHARFNVKKKEYRYRVLLTKEADVFKRNYTFHYPFPLDMLKMKEAADYLIGSHDFTSFCSAKTEVEDRVRTIYEINLNQINGELVFSFIGNGFLYNMVRIIVGTLLDVGAKKIIPEDIPKILLARNREKSGKTAPGHGLYLWKVYYDN